MEYVRTKDGQIHEVLDTDGRLIFVKRNMSELDEPCYGDPSYAKRDIVKEAADPEELCDRTLLHGIDIIFLSQDHTKYRFEGEEDNWYDVTDVEIRMGIYGGIWTPKGIVYAIKMDEKREFGLL